MPHAKQLDPTTGNERMSPKTATRSGQILKTVNQRLFVLGNGSAIAGLLTTDHCPPLP
jgi:hypothetical protein